MNADFMVEQTETSFRKDADRVPLFENEPQTVAGIFYYAAEHNKRSDALNFKKNGKWHPISSNEMVSRAENIALGLYSLGLRKGDRAAMIAANSPEWTLTDAGCQLAGVIDAPIYTTLAADSVCYILNDSGARVFFIENKAAFERIGEVLPDCSDVESLIFFDLEGVDEPNAISLAELEERGASLRSSQPELISELTGALEPSDIATLIYTSGTTGEPKGVMLSHRNLVSNAIDAGANFQFSSDDRPLSVLPLSHVFERSGMYLYILNGMAVHYAESIEKVADNLKEVAPTIFVGVPRIFEKVYAKAKLRAAQESRVKEAIFDWAIAVAKEYALQIEKKEEISYLLSIKHSIADSLVFSKLREFFGGKLRSCITGGAALSDEIYLTFTGAGISIMQGYGLTETSPVNTTNTPEFSRLGTVGKPIRNVQIRTADDGEIEVFGPNVMVGYFNKPEATREVFTNDGWLKTGDIGTIDDDGFLTITDRKKELFKTSGGKYIAPSPIEQLIKGSRYVNQVVLVGNERKFPAALIVPSFEDLEHFARSVDLKIESPAEFCSHPKILELFEAEIEKACERLSRYEKVKKIALIPEELTVEGGEMTPTLKIKRRVVNEKYSGVIDRIYDDAER
ncbi:MAG: long-chain fatty acid--CoA ligase [Pyrinomonadaceae bacterium]|nr:long-chain fatty acid--CoA ligase [Pyrinomonadaceae bacterium]